MKKKADKNKSNVFDGALLLDNPPIDFNTGYWMTIDPGDNTAICYWIDGKMMADTHTHKNCLLKMPKICGLKNKIIIENVELWGGSSVSYASAATGSLFKLAFVIGTLIHTFRQQDCAVYLISPKTWKGQLDYKKLRFILKEKFKIETKNEHEASAIGIGLWALGRF